MASWYQPNAPDLTLADIFGKDAPPQIILWAVAPMLLLVAFEWWWGTRRDLKLYNGKDLLSSAAIGIGNLISTALTKGVVFGAVLLCYNWTPLRIPITWWAFVLCLILLDFLRYWAHRIAHEQRFWWSTHVTHHSSEYYNFSVSFRLSWFQQIKLIFFLPVALLGFHPVVFFVIHQIEVMYQFWIHTEMIRKLPRPIEYVFTTPSHHRVHHARNPKYLDKNYGSTFIIWDRLFGTFQAEEEPAEYGITKPPKTYNPVVLVFHELVDVAKAVWKAPTLRARWRELFGRPY